MSSFKLDPKKTALVIIDLQQGIVARQTAPYTPSHVIERSARLAKSLREKGGTAVYVRVDMNNFLQLPVDQPSRDPNAPPLPAAASELVPASRRATCLSPSAIGARLPARSWSRR